MKGLLPEYQIDWFRFDAVAGLTTAAVVIPKSMAYASIAGLPLQAGLYVSLVPMFVYALLGTSRRLSVSTTSTLAIMTAAQLTSAVPDADAAHLLAAACTLALLVGGLLTVAGVLRLGFLANFLSDPILTGFKSGVAVVILVGQVPKLLGVHIDKGRFFHTVISTLQHVRETSAVTLIVATVSLVILLGMHRFAPKAPAPLVAVVFGVAAAGLLGLNGSGVVLAGHIQAGIPHASLPDLALAKILWPGALGMALMSFTESIALGRAFAGRDTPLPAPNRELIALGAANLAGSFFQCLPAGGGASQTAVNVRAGARTQLSALVTVAVVVATLLFLSPLISLLPQATLAAIVVVTAVPLLSVAEFRSILAVRRMEFLWALAACAGVIIFGTLEGVLVAITISILTLIYQANHPPVYTLVRKPGTDEFRPRSVEHPGDESLPGLLIVRTEGRMTFASAPRAGERLAALINEAKPRVIILECSAIPDFEYTALRALSETEERMREHGVALWLIALNPEAFRVIKRSSLGRALGTERMFVNLADAVVAFKKVKFPQDPSPFPGEPS
jgi:sulfate permease, SulP family